MTIRQVSFSRSDQELALKTLHIGNLQKVDILHCKLVPFFLLSVTNTLADTNNLTCYSICTLQIYDFITQAPEWRQHECLKKILQEYAL
jgi:hypothetical protein